MLEYGAGALNIDGCRVAVTDPDYARNASGDRGHDGNRTREADFAMTAGHAADLGRWPPNVLLSEDAAAELGRASRFFPVFRHETKADSSTAGRVSAAGHAFAMASFGTFAIAAIAAILVFLLPKRPAARG